MHEQLSGGFTCFVSCRQRRKRNKVEKHEQALLLISAIIDYALLTWTLLNLAETCQYIGNAACMAGSALPAIPLVLWPQCNLLLPLLWQQGQPVDFRGASLWKCEYSCLQKSNTQIFKPRRGKRLGNTLNAMSTAALWVGINTVVYQRGLLQSLQIV